MTAPPLFSILIPTRDRPALLRRALRSVLAQGGPDFEIVVADDGAGEGATQAMELDDARISAFSTGERGQVPARNMAVDRARGHFIAFLDDDDWWATPDHLARCAAVLAEGADFAFADGRIVREDNGNAEVAFHAAMDAASIRKDNMLLVSGIAYRRALHERVGAFDESFAVYWDWDFYLRLVEAGVRFSASGGDGVRISARGGTASSAQQQHLRQAELERLAVKHGLTELVLRNHESIALDQEAELGRR